MNIVANHVNPFMTTLYPFSDVHMTCRKASIHPSIHHFRYVIPPASPGPPWGLHADGFARNNSKESCPGGILIRRPNHLNWLLSTPSSLRMSEFLTSSLRLNPATCKKKPNFSLLYLWPCPFGQYPDLMNIGEGRKVHRPVNRKSLVLQLRSTTTVMYSACISSSQPMNCSAHHAIVPSFSL